MYCERFMVRGFYGVRKILRLVELAWEHSTALASRAPPRKVMAQVCTEPSVKLGHKFSVIRLPACSLLIMPLEVIHQSPKAPTALSERYGIKRGVGVYYLDRIAQFHSSFCFMSTQLVG